MLNVKINKKIIFNTIKNINEIISSSAYIPILKGIKIEVTNEKIIFFGSNDIVIIKKEIKKNEDLKIANPGTIVINSSLFLEIISKFGEDNIEIEQLGKNNIIIFSNSLRFEVNLLNKEEFPKIEIDNDEGINFDIEGKELKEVFKNSLISTNEGVNSTIYTSINLILKNEIFYCLSTDSFRITKTKVGIKKSINGEQMIHSKAIKSIIKVISDGKLNVSINNRRLKIIDDQTIIISKVINGTYPNVMKIFEKEYDKSISIKKDELLLVIDKVLAISTRLDTPIKLVIEKEKIKVSLRESEIGFAETFLENIDYSGNEKIEIVLNAKFVLEAIKSITSKVIDILLKSNEKPIVITSKNNKKIEHLILPLKTY